MGGSETAKSRDLRSNLDVATIRNNVAFEAKEFTGQFEPGADLADDEEEEEDDDVSVHS